MLDRLSTATRRWLFLAWLVSGAVVSITMLIVWPFPVELQLALLFCAFAVLALLRSGYARPVSPLAFALGSLLPYVVVRFWLGALASNDGRPQEAAPQPVESAAEESGK